MIKNRSKKLTLKNNNNKLAKFVFHVSVNQATAMFNDTYFFIWSIFSWLF